MANLERLNAIWREFELAAAHAPAEHEQLIVSMKLLAQVIWLSAPPQSDRQAGPGVEASPERHALAVGSSQAFHMPPAPSWSVDPSAAP
jgi:hypothetical protein